MILQANTRLPEYATRQLEKCDFQGEDGLRLRTCTVNIPEKDAVTYIHPETFD